MNQPRPTGYRQPKTRRRRNRFFPVFFALLFLAVLLLLAIGLLSDLLQTPPSPPDGAESTSTPIESTPSESSVHPAAPSAGIGDDDDTETESAPPAPYDYSAPVPASEKADISYFDDAVFIGDSRMEGFIVKNGITNALYFTHQGMTVSGVFSDEVIPLSDGSKSTVMGAVDGASFRKIYIMLGINETGWPSAESFISYYERIIDSIRETHPDAIIYVQSIIPVSQAVNDTHDYVHNATIADFNTHLQAMAEEKKVYFIDLSFLAPGGVLADDAARDGIHLKQDYCALWLDGLLTHTVADKNA